jgi:hypothetical protein
VSAPRSAEFEPCLRGNPQGAEVAGRDEQLDAPGMELREAPVADAEKRGRGNPSTAMTRRRSVGNLDRLVFPSTRKRTPTNSSPEALATTNVGPKAD